MKKVRIALAMIALVMATGAAFATSNNTVAASVECITDNPDVDFLPGTQQIECPGTGNDCCEKDGVPYQRL